MWVRDCPLQGGLRLPPSGPLRPRSPTPHPRSWSRAGPLHAWELLTDTLSLSGARPGYPGLRGAGALWPAGGAGGTNLTWVLGAGQGEDQGPESSHLPAADTHGAEEGEKPSGRL